MSTMYNVFTIEFDNKKPSRAQILKKVQSAIEDGHRAIEVLWGENWLQLDFHPRHHKWYGSGWIKDIGGDAIVDTLNEQHKNELLNLWNT